MTRPATDELMRLRKTVASLETDLMRESVAADDMRQIVEDAIHAMGYRGLAHDAEVVRARLGAAIGRRGKK